MIKGLESKLKILSVPGDNLVNESLNEVRDEKDAPILASAKQAKVNYLVTWNTKDFVQEKIPDIKIVTPAQLVQIILEIST